ncbi:diguanylate cyclase [Rhodospirillum sp. A1_3_36]|uniref:sensor domain-containing diguanylate cyclase n=1 Tax=Rhodospirillum sp. A1_3_36 TaxID=3391666 RepID=UPI0039A5D3D7
MSLRSNSILATTASTWIDFERKAQQRLLDLGTLRELLGYGGFIHDFYDYLLFGDEEQAVRAAAKLDGAVVLLEQYRETASALELRDIEIIEDALVTYRANMEDLREKRAEGLSVAELGGRYKINDGPALAALNRLTDRWRRGASDARDAMSQAVSSGRKATETTLWVMPAFILAGGFVVILLRNLMAISRENERKEAKFRDLFQGSINGLLILGADLRPLHANEAMATMLGLSDAEALMERATLADFLPEEEARALSEIHTQLLSGEIKRTALRMEVLREDRFTVWLDMNARTVEWNEEKAIQLAFLDVTEQVVREREMEFNRAELENQTAELVAVAEDLDVERQRSEAALAEAEEQRRFLQTLLTTMPSPIFYKDLEGRVQGCNGAFAGLYGKTSDTELIGSNLQELADASFTRRTAEIDSELIAKGGTARYERVFTLPNGDRRTMIYNKAVYNKANGDAAGIVGVITDISEQKRMEEELRRLATTDPLTGAFNRRAFMEAARINLIRAARYQEPLTVILADIDYFKRVNDTYGHATGDEALKLFVSTIQGTLRETDVLGRMGGEEFAILLPHTAIDAAMGLANRLRESLAAILVPHPGGTLQFTVSMGVSSYRDHGDSIDALLQSSDEALYVAKEGGRNRVIAATSDRG